MKTQKYSSYYIVPAVICGIATAYVATGSVLFTVLGAVIGLIAAGFWINVIEHGQEA